MPTELVIKTLPEYKQPLSLEDAKLAINQLGKNLHEHAYIVGGILIWAKRKTGHGKFEEWIKQNIWFSPRTGEHFMAYAKECDKVKQLLEYHGLGFKGVDSTPLNWLRVYNVWNFAERDESLGIEYPGNIPGQIAMNVIHYYTNEGDLVVDPMAGGGSTIDACKKLNRRCLAYDINCVRKDIQYNDITKGFPPETQDCQLIFLDPPYHNLLQKDYVASSVSSLALIDFLDFIEQLAVDCHTTVKKGGFVTFLCQNFYHKFASFDGGCTNFTIEGYKRFTNAGFQLVNEINCPQTSQVYSAGDVQLAKAQKGMLNLVRDLFVYRKVA